MVDRAKELLADADAWIRRHRWSRIGRRAVLAFLNHEALQFAGSMAYFAVLSIFQLVVLAVIAASFLLGEGEGRQFVVDTVTGATPLDEATITSIIDAVIESRGGIGLVSLAFLTWSALGVFSAMNNGIGRAFELAPKRPFWKDKLIGLFIMALTGILAIVSIAIGFVTGVLQRATADFLETVPGGGLAIDVVGIVVPIVLIFVAFWVIYRVVPNKRVSFAEVWPGAAVAAILWTVLQNGFTYYATNVANYESAFGPISTGISLLVFLYFASVIVLLGAEVARASAIDDELGEGASQHVTPAGTGADPRLLPVPVAPPPTTAPAGRGPLPRPVLVAGGAAIAAAGILLGRLTKRGREYVVRPRR
jgi:membrane protein